MDYQTLYLVRHAESALSGKYCGSTDAPLSIKGFKQAKKVAQVFNRIPLDICYFSDLKRARQTIQYFNPKTSSVKTSYLKSRELREIHFGDWEAYSFAQVSSQWPELYRRWLKSPATAQIPSGESFPAFLSRVKAFSEKLAKNSAKHVAVVAHAGSLSALTMLLLKKPLTQFWKWIPPNASISTLKRALNGKASKFKMVRMKDCGHLDQ